VFFLVCVIRRFLSFFWFVSILFPNLNDFNTELLENPNEKRMSLIANRKQANLMFVMTFKNAQKLSITQQLPQRLQIQNPLRLNYCDNPVSSIANSITTQSLNPASMNVYDLFKLPEPCNQFPIDELV